MEPKARTLEERLKFDSGLAIGRHPVRLTHQGREVKALAEIGKRGAVSLLVEPQPEDMYSCWRRVRGDITTADGAVIVWGARDPAVRALFTGEPAATIAV
jgi:hypothetical protein